jgi:hypothetical protein
MLYRCKKPSKSMPSKASLPSALVDPGDIPQSLDSSGKHSKQSSPRSKLSSNSSNAENSAKSPWFKSFKSFRRRKEVTSEHSGHIATNNFVVSKVLLIWKNLILSAEICQNLVGKIPFLLEIHFEKEKNRAPWLERD